MAQRGIESLFTFLAVDTGKTQTAGGWCGRGSTGLSLLLSVICQVVSPACWRESCQASYTRERVGVGERKWDRWNCWIAFSNLVLEVIHHPSFVLFFSLKASHEGWPILKGRGSSLYLLMGECQRICEFVWKPLRYHEPWLRSSSPVSTFSNRAGPGQKRGRSVSCPQHPSLHNCGPHPFRDLSSQQWWPCVAVELLSSPKLRTFHLSPPPASPRSCLSRWLVHPGQWSPERCWAPLATQSAGASPPPAASHQGQDRHSTRFHQPYITAALRCR